MRFKRNGFLTFCFACLPGAGQMFLGFMKRGISLMAIFFGIIALAGLLGIDLLLFAVPVIWFYSFFDTMNKNALTIEELNELPDRFLWIEDENFQLFSQGKSRMVVAVALIVIGVYSLLQMLWDILAEALGGELPSWLYGGIFYDGPRILFSLAIIAVGIYLMGVRKPKQIEEDDLDD
ncbi:MAG: hypothetical protein K2K70_00855 [Lachnospiraceae bacterium]|nr:hypothetical protein [Lachnospiraceae bacterium]